jgi:UDP-glucose 4-epimerase
LKRSMTPFQGRKALITGGLGFIGSTLARRLLDEGADVVLVDNLNPDHGGNLYNISGIEDRLRLERVDAADFGRMSRLVEGCDFLFNLAGQTSHLDSMQNPTLDMEINCRAQLSVLEACRKSNPTIRIVFASTRQIYGKPSRLPVDETALLNPVDINGIHKMAAEGYHLLYNNVYGIRACALRLTNTIGPRMRVKDGRQTFLGIWARLLLEGKPFDVWEGKQQRDFTYVDDAVDAFLLAAQNDRAPGQVYNLGGIGAFNLLEVAEMMVAANGGGSYRVRPFPPERKAIDIGDYYADFAKISSQLEWKPKVPVPEALSRTLSFYRDHLRHYV